MQKETSTEVVQRESVREGFWQKYILRANKQNKPKSGFLKRREAKSLKGTRVGDLTVDEKLALGFFVSPEEMEKFEATLPAAKAPNGYFSRFAVPQIPQGVAGAWGVPANMSPQGVNASAFTQPGGFGAPNGAPSGFGTPNGVPSGAGGSASYAQESAPEVEEAEIVGDLTGPVPRMKAGEPLPEGGETPSGAPSSANGAYAQSDTSGTPEGVQSGGFGTPDVAQPSATPPAQDLAQAGAQPAPVGTPNGVQLPVAPPVPVPVPTPRKRYSLPKSSGNAAGHWGAPPVPPPVPEPVEEINLQSSNSAAQEIHDLRAQLKFTIENHQVEMAEKDLKIKQLNERIADFHARVGDMSKVIEKMTNRIITQGSDNLSQESKAKAVFEILETGHKSYFQNNTSLQKVVEDIFNHRFDDVAHETDGQH
jgi:hypothetical protein